jgi:peptide-methionine (S)-S-oxide reductase
MLLASDDCLPGRSVPIAGAPPDVTQHLVLHTPLYPPWPHGCEVAAFGMGCVWCTEAVFLHKAPSGSLHSTQAGVAGGVTPNPTNDEVHTGCTNHAEVCRVVFYPDRICFDTLLKIFFETHDPTAVNRQGPDDIGTEYRSAVYCTSDKQLRAAESAKVRAASLLRANGLRDGEVVTEIAPLREFYLAEVEHQQHDWRPGVRAGCGLVPTGLKMGALGI